MKIIKNIWNNRKLFGFTLMNALLFVLSKTVTFAIQSSFIWVLGYILIERFLGEPFISFIHFTMFFFLLKISVAMLTHKSKS